MFLIDTLLPWLQQLHRTEDVRVAARVLERIGQPVLSDNPSSKEYYVEIQEAVENARMFSYS